MTKFYYLRDKGNNPVITVCLMQNEEGNYSKGMAICSDLDNPVKHVGRGKAYGRAKKALEGKGNFAPIKRDEAYIVLNRVFPEDSAFGIRFKSLFNPTLTEYEEKLLGMFGY